MSMRRLVLLATATLLLCPIVDADAAAPAPTVVAQIKLPTEPVGGLMAFGSIWALSDLNTAWLTRIDPTTNRPTGSVFLGYGEVGGDDLALRPVTAADGSLWVSRSFRNDVVRVSPTLLTITKRIKVGRSPAGIAAIDGAVFVADSRQSELSKINPRTNRVVAGIPVGRQHDFSGGPYQLRSYDHLLWVTVPATKRLLEINPRSNRIVRRNRLGPAIGCGELLPAPHGFWMNDVVCSQSVFRFDTRSHRVTATYTASSDGCFYGATVFDGHLVTEESPLVNDDCVEVRFVQRNIDTGVAVQQTDIRAGVSFNLETVDGSLWAVDDTHIIRFADPWSAT
jgi:DNA-binding beta-propeller fold protein YncE